MNRSQTTVMLRTINQAESLQKYDVIFEIVFRFDTVETRVSDPYSIFMELGQDPAFKMKTDPDLDLDLDLDLDPAFRRNTWIQGYFFTIIKEDKFVSTFFFSHFSHQ